MYDTPIEAIFMPELVIGSRETFTFNIHTGQLSSVAQNLLESQTWLFIEKWEYGTVEFSAELPGEPGQLFNSALNDIRSQEVPQTDFDLIIGQVIELTDRYALNFLSQPGWTHLQYQSFVPVSTKGNGLESYGMETTQLFPDDATIEDYWFNNGNDADYGEGVHHVSDKQVALYSVLL
jgi:hypothetical protein